MEAPLSLPETLIGDGLILDAPTVADAEAHLAREDREMRVRFEAPDPDAPPSLAHVRQVMRAWIATRAAGGPNIVYAIREANHALAGGCELRRQSDGSLHVSYWIYPAFRGRGLAARAVRRLCEALPATGADRVEAHIDPDNRASRRTAEAAGFALAGEAADQAQGDGSPLVRLRYVRRLRA